LTDRKAGITPLPTVCSSPLCDGTKDVGTMSHLPRELHDDFPQASEKIRLLKSRDESFTKLAEAYHELNQAVHRMETGFETVADEVLEDAKKMRLQAKDRIAEILARA
jgi:uncharacterized protein YdcH (DUF465 family)